jgi:hypothetical protein
MRHISISDIINIHGSVNDCAKYFKMKAVLWTAFLFTILTQDGRKVDHLYANKRILITFPSSFRKSFAGFAVDIAFLLGYNKIVNQLF